MRGYIKRTKSGNYKIRVYLGKDNKTGKKKYHTETVHGEHAAEDRVRELINSIKHNEYVKPSRITTGQYLDYWLEKYKPNLAPRTGEVYEMNIRNHVKPILGDILLTKLQRTDILDFISDRIEAKKSAQSVRHYYTMLHKALNSAIEWGYLTRNPSDNITLPRVIKPEMQVWSADEINQFLDYVKTHEFEKYALFYLDLHSGLRRSELLGLKWKDIQIDLIEGFISIRRGLQQRRGGEFAITDTKTKKSTRLIPMTPSTIPVISAHKDYCKRIAKETKITFNDDTWVFCHLDSGDPLVPNTVTEAWTRLAKAAGLRHIRLHDARHSFASIHLRQGTHPKIVSDMLGHSNIGITLDTYSHVTPGLKQAAAKAFDAEVNPEYNKEVEKSLDSQKITKIPNT